jgi:hypothetical protein
VNGLKTIKFTKIGTVLLILIISIGVVLATAMKSSVKLNGVYILFSCLR